MVNSVCAKRNQAEDQDSSPVIDQLCAATHPKPTPTAPAPRAPATSLPSSFHVMD